MRATVARKASENTESPGASPERAAIDYGLLERRLGYALRRAQIAVFRDFFAAFEAYDIRPGQYSILTVIECNPGLKQGEVSEALGIKRANFVAMIDELERRGLVRRDSTPKDRRSYALVLTARGQRLMHALHAAADTHEQRLIETLGAETVSETFITLGKLAKLPAR